MKNTIKLFSIIALVALIGFSFVSCVQEEEEDGVLSAGTYTTISKLDTAYNAGDESYVIGATTVLKGIDSPSFTVDADGVITALSLGGGGTAFLSWVPASGTQYRFTLSGGYLNFQVKQGNSFVNWNPHSASLNTVNYNQSIDGTSRNGVIQLTLRYQRTDNQGGAWRTYSLKKQ